MNSILRALWGQMIISSDVHELSLFDAPDALAFAGITFAFWRCVVHRRVVAFIAGLVASAVLVYGAAWVGALALSHRAFGRFGPLVGAYYGAHVGAALVYPLMATLARRVGGADARPW